MDQSVRPRPQAPWPIRALRIVAWSWLGAGVLAAVIIWLNARETVSVTRTVTAHASLTFQDIETHVSALRVSMGFVSVLIGLTIWAVLLVVCWRADRGSEPVTARAPSTSG
jgi:hypothetical protein